MPKYIKMIFFYFLKINFEISTSKRLKTYKKINFFGKKEKKTLKNPLKKQIFTLKLYQK